MQMHTQPDYGIKLSIYHQLLALHPAGSPIGPHRAITFGVEAKKSLQIPNCEGQRANECKLVDDPNHSTIRTAATPHHVL